MRQERGSALITVILVVFVLTMVGIAALFYMTTEDRISGTDKLQKAAMYAAETGLRWGEKSLVDQAKVNANYIGTALTHPSANNLDVPGGGYLGIPLTDPTVVGEVLDQPLPSGNEGYQATYSLYVRNNVEDTTNSATVDGDTRVNLISVGLIQTGSGQTVRKVIEEQMFVGGTGGEGGPQKGGNTGGTGSGGIR